MQNQRSGDGLFKGKESSSSLQSPKKQLLLQKGCEIGCNQATVPNEFSVIAREAQKTTQRLRLLRLQPIDHGIQLGWINLDSLDRNEMAQIINFAYCKETLGKLCKKLMLHQHFEHLTQMEHMID